MDPLNLLLDGLKFVLADQKWVAPFLIGLPMLAWAVWLSLAATRKTAPWLAAARARRTALEAALGDDPSPEAERAAFARDYMRADAALSEAGPGAAPLVAAWREFHESIVDETVTPVRNTVRPSVYFAKAAPKQTRLVFWSNLLVGLGLLFTFLGLIAALHAAAQGMRPGAGTEEMQASLLSLLNAAAAKFFTSVAGVGGSLILRGVERRLSKQTAAETEAICALLERGLLYVPPQRLAAEQLDELKRQTAQLTTFNTDFALQVSERMGAQFQTAMAPVAASLASLNESMGGMGASIRESLDGGAAKAVSESAGAELRALGATLATLGEQLAGLGASVGQSGDAAAEQIRAAGEQFAEAARDIRGAFETLVGQVDGVGEKLSAQSETAAKGIEETLVRALAGLEAAQTRSTEQLETAVQALQSAGAGAAVAVQREVETALATGFAEGQARFRGALEEGGEALRATTAGLAKSVGDAAQSVERAAAGFVRSGESAVRAAEGMEGVTGQARQAATVLGDASKGFATAAAPVAQAATAVSGAADRLAAAAATGREAENSALAAFRGLAEETRDAQAAAAQAWAEYRSRFQQLDENLGRVLLQLRENLDGALSKQGEFATAFDTKLAEAVGKLAGNLDVVADQSENLGTVAIGIEKAAKAMERAADRLSPALEAAE